MYQPPRVFQPQIILTFSAPNGSPVSKVFTIDQDRLKLVEKQSRLRSSDPAVAIERLRLGPLLPFSRTRRIFS